MGPSIWHILVVVLVFMVLFGAGRLPRAMEDFAKGIKSFKKGLKDDDDDLKDGGKSASQGMIARKDDSVIDVTPTADTPENSKNSHS